MPHSMRARTPEMIFHPWMKDETIFHLWMKDETIFHLLMKDETIFHLLMKDEGFRALKRTRPIRKVEKRLA
jgi:hypothetical protein